MESDGPLSGLGWRSSVHPSPSRSAEADQKGCGDGVREPGGSLTESLMQQYVQQCLEFHESQELQRKGESDASVRQVQFVNAESGYAPATVEPTAVLSPRLAESDPDAFLRSVEEGRSRAQAILDRFHQQQQNLLMYSGGDDSAPAPDSSAQGQDSPECDPLHASHRLPQGIPETIQVHTPNASAHGGCYPSVALFIEQRTKGLQREALHKHRFLLRNLEYVARREQQRAQILADSIEASKSREAHVQDQYSLALLERQRLLRESAIIAKTSKAAIGSRPRRDVERMKRKSYEHGSDDIYNEPGSTTSSVALYLAGLPVDGTVDEAFLRRLFEPYAPIQRVHLYRDKTKGQLKGDALIAYQPSHDTGHVNLLSDVCSQMNGVELPCGSVLTVEPAYGASTVSFGAKPSNDFPQYEAEEPKIGVDDNEDLDDFFSSL